MFYVLKNKRKQKKKNYFLVVKRIFLFFLFKIIFENNYQIDPNFLYFYFAFPHFQCPSSSHIKSQNISYLNYCNPKIQVYDFIISLN